MSRPRPPTIRQIRRIRPLWPSRRAHPRPSPPPERIVAGVLTPRIRAGALARCPSVRTLRPGPRDRLKALNDQESPADPAARVDTRVGPPTLPATVGSRDPEPSRGDRRERNTPWERLSELTSAPRTLWSPSWRATSPRSSPMKRVVVPPPRWSPSRATATC